MKSDLYKVPPPKIRNIPRYKLAKMKEDEIAAAAAANLFSQASERMMEDGRDGEREKA